MNTARVRLGDLSVSFVHSLSASLQTLGHSAQPLLDQFGLDATRLAEPRARLSIPRYMRLGHAAIQLSNSPHLGLLMGRHAHLSHAGLAGVTAAQAPTVREAARALIRFEPLYASNYRGHSSLHEDAQGAWLRFYSISPYNAYNRFVVDSVLSTWKQQLSSVAQQPVNANKVCIEFAEPSYAEHYSEIFAAPVEFSASVNQLHLNLANLALPNPLHCPSTWRHLLEICEQELQQLTLTRILRERITQLLGPILHGHEPDMAEIATRLQLPTWTLRRKLAEEGTQFRTILNHTRRDLAMAYIRDTELAFGEIAFLLGFASAEAFQRAFKRWSKQTPGEFRRTQRLAD